MEVAEIASIIDSVVALVISLAWVRALLNDLRSYRDRLYKQIEDDDDDDA